jgi:hypothetical protein
MESEASVMDFGPSRQPPRPRFYADYWLSSPVPPITPVIFQTLPSLT